MATSETVLNDAQGLSAPERTAVALSVVEGLNSTDKQTIARALADPSQNVTDRIWMIVVVAFVVVFVGSFVMMAVSLLNGKIIDDKLITVFTAVSAFLAGLLAPSPVAKTNP